MPSNVGQCRAPRVERRWRRGDVEVEEESAKNKSATTRAWSCAQFTTVLLFLMKIVSHFHVTTPWLVDPRLSRVGRP